MKRSKKQKLFNVLKKLGEPALNESEVFYSAIDKIESEISKTKSLIPNMPNLSPIIEAINNLRGTVDESKIEWENKYQQLEGILESTISYLELEIENNDKSGTIIKQSNSLEEIKKEVEEIRTFVLTRQGGGSAHRQISINSTVVAKKYADINLIAGSNITLSSSDNNTTKKTDITISSTGGTPVVFVYNEFVGYGNGSGTPIDYTILNIPTTGTVRVYVDGLRQRLTTDYTFSGNTISFVMDPPVGAAIIADYNM